MKRFALLILVLTFVSCKKDEKVPEGSTQAPRPKLFNYNVSGFVANSTRTVSYPDQYGNNISFKGIAVIDSASVYINDVLRFKETYLYQQELKTGDKLKFYFSGKRDTTKKECTFNIWQDKNEQPVIITFKSENKILQGEYTIP